MSAGMSLLFPSLVLLLYSLIPVTVANYSKKFDKNFDSQINFNVIQNHNVDIYLISSLFVNYLYVSSFEKIGEFAQKLVFHLSWVHNSALLNLHNALYLKSLAAYVSKKQVRES